MHFYNLRIFTCITCEVGPAEEPICSNCRFLDVGLYLERPEQREKLILADARQMPLKEKSVDVFNFKNFPWLLPANVKTNGYQKMFERMQISYTEYNDIIARSHLDRQIIFQELNRVLTDEGVFIILFSLGSDEPGEMGKHLSHFVVEAESMGFVVEETNNIRHQSSDRLKATAKSYGQSIPLGGLIFHRPKSFVLK